MTLFPLVVRSIGFAGLMLACACASSAAAPSPTAPVRRDLDAQFQAALAQAVASDPNIPVAIAVVRSPRMGLDFAGGVAGARETQTATPVLDRPFRIASITKVFTSASIFRLAEMGRVDLDAPIARYIPAETAAALRGDGYDPDRITVTHLLGHSSGLVDHAEEAYVHVIEADPHHRWTPQEQIAFGMSHGDPLGQPGDAFHYSDTGYVILGQIIERQSGEPYAAAIRHLLKLDRLGLHATWYETLEPAQTNAPHLRQYFGDLESTEWDASMDLWGGGGVITTASDLATFIRAVMRGEIFDRPETLAAALTVPVMRDQASGDAHNLLLFRQRFGHRTCYGHSGFWAVMAIYCPADDLTVIVTVNNGASGRSFFGLINRIAEIIESAP